MEEPIIVTIAIIAVAIVFLGMTFGFVELDDLTPPKDSKKLNGLWHFYKALFQGTIFIAIAHEAYGHSWKVAVMVLMLLSMTACIFNPVINKVRKRGDFFYISKSGIEGHFYRYPRLYWFLNATITVGGYLVLILL